MAKLSKKIVKILAQKLNKSENTIRVGISKLRSSKFHNALPNAVAYIYAQQHGETVWQKLSKEEKQSVPNHEVINSAPKVQKRKIEAKEKDIELIKYESSNHFIKGHIKEINKSYTKHCYTSTFILARKIIENLIIDILIKRFPSNKRENKELYYDINQRRFKDFSVILKNLYDKRREFSVEKVSVIERLYVKAKELKDKANDTTHSWFYLVEGRKEIDELHLQSIIELIKQIEI